MKPLSEQGINTSAFLNKLWKMINDPKTDDLIHWSEDGTSFMIHDDSRFWYELLPAYYKHKNMSSFVRQLNMYGFHKVSNIEMSDDKEEFQFYNKYFQREKPELIRQIKRKVPTNKIVGNTMPGTDVMDANNIPKEDITKVLTEVKHLKGRQVSIDSQLSSLKNENTVLWRELALLRQKHIKQQSIVNKLIQFLVTIVQPSSSARMGGLGVKRCYPLMINESPLKKQKVGKPESTTSEGPVIHELEAADALTEELLATSENIEEEEHDIDAADYFFAQKSKMMNDKSLKDECPTDSELDESIYGDEELDEESNVDEPSMSTNTIGDNDDKFINPSAQDTLLSNLMNGSYKYNTHKLQRNKQDPTTSTQDAEESSSNGQMAVVSRETGHPPPFNRLNSVEDLGIHVESTQNELEQYKDILNGSFDANALLTLFADENSPYSISYNQLSQQHQPDTSGILHNDPLVSGSEITPYDGGTIDFSQLLDDSSEELPLDFLRETSATEESITTPQIINSAPIFPNTKYSK